MAQTPLLACLVFACVLGSFSRASIFPKDEGAVLKIHIWGIFWPNVKNLASKFLYLAEFWRYQAVNIALHLTHPCINVGKFKMFTFIFIWKLLFFIQVTLWDFFHIFRDLYSTNLQERIKEGVQRSDTVIDLLSRCWLYTVQYVYRTAVWCTTRRTLLKFMW